MPASDLRRQFVWTPIPAGRVALVPGHSTPKALLSVLLTPRLIAPPAERKLKQFGMQTWPERLAAIRFDVFRGTQPVVSYQVPHVTIENKEIRFTTAQQLSAWKALFSGESPVTPYGTTSYGNRDVHEFPASEAAAEVRQAYTATGRVHLDHDGEVPETHPELRAELSRVSAMWQARLAPLDGTAGEDPSAPRSALARAYAFYRRENDSFTALPPSTATSVREFHDTVARLADHPLLLRALGLLVDLAVEIAPLTAAGGEKELRVVPRWPNPDSSAPPGWSQAVQDDLSPKTAYLLDGTRFVTASLPGPTATELKRGMLPLAGTGVTSPAGDAGGRYEVVPFDVDGAALRMVGVAGSARDQPAERDGADVAALPALRSMGFALVERDRGQEHSRQLRRAAQRATAAGLTSQPVTADSLLGGYRVDVYDVVKKQWYPLCRRRVRYKIGDVTIGQAASGGTGPAGLLEEGFVRPEASTTGADDRDALYIHQTVMRWDGWSLVAERPERIVDTGDEMPVAAQAPPFEAVVETDPGSLPRLRFGRDYRLRVRIADLAGGGLRPDETGAQEEWTNVFRHHRFEPLPPPELVPTRRLADGETLDLMVIRSDRDTTAEAYAAAHGHRAFDLRHLLAPACSLDLALQHERTFDAALGPDVPAAKVKEFFEVAKRADQDVSQIHGATVVGAESGSTVPAPYVYLPETGVSLPWLADPATKSVALNPRRRPVDPETGTYGTVVGDKRTGVWRGTWPAYEPISLRLEGGPKGCKLTRSSDQRTFIVTLGPAEEVTFDIASCPDGRAVQLFGIVTWLGIDVTNETAFAPITEGRNRLITPPRTVTLVHAVQRPLAPPSGLLTARRAPGDTSAVLRTDGLRLHIASTGRLDLRAAWTDREDLPPNQPTQRERTAILGPYDVQRAPRHEAYPTIRQEFGDTRRRRVTYRATAVSRFRALFPRVTAADPQACLSEGVLEVTDVPSSARPPAPKVLHTVPTFRWTRSHDGQKSLTRWRYGGGLRVLLERPWYASGDDERLAVLTLPAPSAPADVLRYVSVAGRDPIWTTGAPPPVLNRSDVVAPRGERAELPELERVLDVIAYPVRFDAEADRWYADIDLSPLVTASYFPFVRLAVARYQDHTAEGVPTLSPAVRTEPVQLPPHRRLVVTRTAGRATVLLDGLGPEGPRPNQVRCELQVGPAAATGGGAGWSTVLQTSGPLGQARDLDLPTTGDRPQRIVVQEYETHPQATNDTGSAVESQGRLVFVDIVPLGAW
ncbi:hypothetical protein BN159_0091 [Streptomyces davaonensis JCM 4913]|uniref:Uncharacterized protein n=1 Tax=Streptomyces davaonensis (strain DSM 101723 / JCM 4913 / KCC S-0913 / 768) TaxID=1214101 RepID=K4QUN0_STRDJ|nr:hypothetical protein [Streptomyces davaonensis]CCK24470.1 hypothetical protein BN159_0091 [Streptomyces davaonensis JCM 4913]